MLHFERDAIEAGLKNPVVLVAQGFGSGSLYPFPGTWGTFAGFVVYLTIAPFISYEAWAIWVLIACVIGVPLCSYAERIIGIEDPHSVVWDEWCGIWICFLFLPPKATLLLTGFILFRLLDGFKPWIIGMAQDKLRKGLGIMMDDILAGIVVCIILQLILFFTAGFGIILP